jgi:hypothetical protein
MAKQLQLSIPTPCHENWDNMTPVQQGKFCGSCQKQVIDFSNMSDRQVAEFFKKPSTGSVCGRFMTDQLERDIEIPRKRIPWLKYFFQFVIPAFLVSIRASAEKTQGQIRVRTVTTDTTKRPLDVKVGMLSRPICNRPLMGDTIITPVKYPIETVKGEISNVVIDQRNRTIVGKVTDEKGDALPGASITIKGTRTGVSVDNTGQFRILAKTGNILVVSGAGLGTTEVVVGTGNTISIAVTRLIYKGQEVVVTAGMVMVKRPLKKSVKKELKNVPLMKEALADPSEDLFKVFPNPVPSGSDLNLELKQTEEGYYTLQILNQSGQSVHQEEIWIDAEARLLNIDVPAVAAGTYFLALTNKRSGKRSTKKIIIW